MTAQGAHPAGKTILTCWPPLGTGKYREGVQNDSSPDDARGGGPVEVDIRDYH